MTRLATIFFFVCTWSTTAKLCAENPRHWAYMVPKRAPLPAVRDTSWPRSAIDYFVLSRLEGAGLSPSAEADPATLARRATLDLTGLPPELVDLDAYLMDRSPASFEKLVSRLLADPHYGERMAQPWLDAARYSDTHGYLIDAHRDMWPWRDWVIDAFNQNMSFDQFTIEQLAGDLIPRATRSQQIASGFNRNHMINYENGAIAEQYRAEYVADRVATFGTVWLGQTFDCARCHDHKYDPLSTREFYQLFAFFNNVAEEGLDGNRGNAAPTISAPTEQQQLRWDVWQQRITQLDKLRTDRQTAAASDIAAWEAKTIKTNDKMPVATALVRLPLDSLENRQTAVETNIEARRSQAVVQGAASLVPGKSGQALLLDGASYVELKALDSTLPLTEISLALWLYPTTQDRMVITSFQDPKTKICLSAVMEGGHLTIEVHDGNKSQFKARVDSAFQLRRWQHVVISFDSVSKLSVYRDGQPLKITVEGSPTTFRLDSNSNWSIGGQANEPGWRGMIDDVGLFPRQLSPHEIQLLAENRGIEQVISIPRDRRTAEQQTTIDQFYLNHFDDIYRSVTRELTSLQRQLAIEQQSAPTVMVMREEAIPRDTHVLLNGEFDRPGEKVAAETPSVLHEWPSGRPRNRLGLAHWIVDTDNPLTARVVVNRIWMQFFGAGLVRTPEDFGVRGEPPTDQALLDWLAVEFVASGWDVKHIVRLIVTSATYRQSSRVRTELARVDPENRYWGVAPRIRFDAETIRDSALSVSGLLNNQVGGPSVFPFQPSGLWEEISFNPAEYTAQSYHESKGHDLYRRGLYTFWKRTLPHPVMTIFDAPTREKCTVSRGRTNTPQQSLLLMNEPAMLEAARHLAQIAMTEGGAEPSSRCRWAFRRVTSRWPTEDELQDLIALHEQQLTHFRDLPEEAAKLVNRNNGLDPVEFAVWTTVANVLLSLDEVITRN